MLINCKSIGFHRMRVKIIRKRFYHKPFVYDKLIDIKGGFFYNAIRIQFTGIRLINLND